MIFSLPGPPIFWTFLWVKSDKILSKKVQIIFKSEWYFPYQTPIFLRFLTSEKKTWSSKKTQKSFQIWVIFSLPDTPPLFGDQKQLLFLNVNLSNILPIKPTWFFHQKKYLKKIPQKKYLQILTQIPIKTHSKTNKK